MTNSTYRQDSSVIPAAEPLKQIGCKPEPLSGDSPDPLLVTVDRAGELLSCGKTKIFDLINRGQLERRKLGRATRITLSSIRQVAGV